jgi:HK97 family phage prohead protease
MTMKRAYSVLDIKAAEDAGGVRAFAGIATTPAVDSMSDIVEPRGAQFKLPIPLLWQHDSGAPIGWVKSCNITDKGIEVRGEVASIAEPGPLKERLDMAWQSMKAQLVRGLSIGFQALESQRIENTYGYRYAKWLWLELSAVTIPANAECSITAIKSADLAIRRAASGALPVVRLDPAGGAGANEPGVSGNTVARRKGVIYLK